MGGRVMFDESMRGVMDRLETEEADEAGAFMGTARVIPVSVVKPAPVIIEGAPCRNALARDGKPYPKSSCQRCGTLLRSGWKCANGVEI